MDNYYDKLKALLEALEVQNIEHLLLNGDVETYQIIGEMIAQKCKGVKWLVGNVQYLSVV